MECLFMRKLILFFLGVLFTFSSSGQNVKNEQEIEVVNHQVQLDESVRMLSKKYSVDPADIYRLNRFAVDGIEEGMILKIPVSKKEVSFSQEINKNTEIKEVSTVVSETIIEEKQSDKLLENNTADVVVSLVESKPQVIHTVQSKETLFGLSKKYNVSVDEIKSANEEILKSGLKTGQVITIPSKKNAVNTEAIVTNRDFSGSLKTETAINHKVKPKETLYGLSKKYDVTIDEIKNQNQEALRDGLQVGQILKIKKG